MWWRDVRARIVAMEWEMLRLRDSMFLNDSRVWMQGMPNPHRHHLSP
jgi:hypothetical protein